MKTIELSDENYEILMELSKELQLQDNNHQAFPYFWEPSSMKAVLDANGEGDIIEVVKDCELQDLESFAEYEEDHWNNFCLHHQDDGDAEFESYSKESPIPYDKKFESRWVDYIEYYIDEATIYTSNLEYQEDHNPSLFRSDVVNYINSNRNHLGKEPRTYPRTIWRMPKMERLVKAIYQINPQPIEDIVSGDKYKFVVEEVAEDE